MAKVYRIEVIDHTEDEKYRSIAQASDYLGICVTTLRNIRAERGNRFKYRGHDLEFRPTECVGFAKKVKCIENGTIYKSAAEAGRVLGIGSSTILGQIYGKQKAAKGYHFRRV